MADCTGKLPARGYLDLNVNQSQPRIFIFTGPF